MTDLFSPASEGKKGSSGQLHVDEESHEPEVQPQQYPLGGSASEPSSPLQPADAASDDEGSPFVPGRRRRGPLSVHSSLHKQDEEALAGCTEPCAERQYSTRGSLFQEYQDRNGRKRMHVACTHADDDDVPSKALRKVSEMLILVSPVMLTCIPQEEDEPQRHRKARKRSGNSDGRSRHPGRITMQGLCQPRHRRHCQDYDARSQLSESRVESTLQELQEQPTWAVDRVVKCARKHGEVFYKVKWKDTWEPAASLLGCADTAVAEFHAKHRA